ncbi:MAG: DUF4411 family protein [Alphaproteobacteria bacterium]|nr:DUF4411 family protein [Alphaproteobacteria bacterium]
MAVLNETSKRSKDLYTWLSQRDTMFVDFKEGVQLAVRDILAQFPRLVGERKHRTSADPFVIATAQLRGLVVVTEEKPTASLNRPNIPDVCAELDVKCINLIELIRAEKWVSG